MDANKPVQPTISIHAPTRGATNNLTDLKVINDDFNPRTHEGCDDVGRANFADLFDFNPRTHEGCDAEPASFSAGRNHFNPRTHEGCDSGKS